MSNLKNFFASQWKMQTELPNGDTLSTVMLPMRPNGSEVYESCWFYANGTSEVVAHYFTEKMAARGHCALILNEEMV